MIVARRIFRKIYLKLLSCGLPLVLIFSIILQPFFGIVPLIAEAASVPTILSYQGRLADSSGNLLGGTGTSYYFKFSIWDNSTVGSGSRVWPTSTPTSFSATVREGVFNVNIGDTANGYPDTLDYNFSENSNVYLQVEVSSNGSSFETLSPRQRIGSSAFAQVSGAVSGTQSSVFGATTPAANSVVTIVASSTTAIPLTIKGAALQSASLFQIQNAAGANLFTVNQNGQLSIGVTTPTTILGDTGTSTFSGGVKLNTGNFQVATLTGCDSIDTDADGNFICGTDATGAGGGIATIKENNSSVVTSASALDFLGADFDVTNSPAGEGNIAIDYTNSGITRRGQDETITGGWTFSNLIATNATTTNATSTNFTVTGNSNLGTVTSGTWQGAAIAVGYGGTGLTSTPTYGQILQGTGSGYTLVATSSLGLITTDVAEGSNLYFTNDRADARADARINATSTITTLTSLPGLSTIGTITSGVWNGTAIGDSYMTKTGNWTGTFDGQEGTYYLNANNLTNFGSPFYNYFSATTTDALAQGSTNKYYASSLFDTDFALKSTTNLTEGSNLYYTPLRVASVIAGTTTDALAQGSTNKYYSTTLFNGDLATKSTSDLAEGTNLYYTPARVAGVIAGTTTDALAEGMTNKYFTNTRFDNRLSATTSLPNITSLTNLASVGTITSGIWNGTAIADGYLTKTGDWTGTLDGQEGSYYLANSFGTTSANVWLSTKSTSNLVEGSNLYYTANRVASVIAGTTTDALVQGSINKYYSSSLFDADFALKTTTNLTEGSNLYYTPFRVAGVIAGTTTDALAQGSTNKYYSSTLFNGDLATKSTSDLAEGTNLYYTPSRVAGVIAGTTTDALAQGSTNKYWSNTLFDNRLSATTTLPNITGLTNLASIGTITSGVWQGTAIADGYLTKTGDWTGTLDGQEGGYYLANSFATTSADVWLTTKSTSNLGEGTNLYFTPARVAGVIAGTTTDALAQGSTNKYYNDSFVNSYINGSSTIAKAYSSNTFSALNTFNGGVTIDSLNGPLQANNGVVSATTTIGARYGGTGQTSYTTGDLLYANSATSLARLPAGSNGLVLKLSGGVPTWGTDLTSGGGGGAGAWATTTDSLAVYPTDTTNVVIIGSNATTSTGNIFEVVGNAKFGTITGGVWNGTAIADAYLTKTGDWTGTLDGQEGDYYLDANNLTNFSTPFNTSFSAKSTSDLAEGSNLYYTLNRVAGVIAGTTTDALAQGSTNKYYSTILFNGDLATKSTSDLAEGTNLYYTPNRVAAVIAGTTTDALAEGTTNVYYTLNRFASGLAGTTTDALAEGSNNKYFTNTRFDNRLSATTTLPSITTLSNLASIGTITSGVWNGTAIADGYLTKTGDWTGTLDGQEGSYYLANSFATSSASYFLGTKSTSDLAEGSNKYYTDGRVATVIAGTTTDALAQGSTNKYYSTSLFNTDFALKSTTNLTEGTNLYYTPLRVAGVIAGTTTDALAQGSTNKYYSSTLFNGDLATKSTSDLAEGTNLYYTPLRVAGVIAGTTTDALAQGSTNKYWSNTLFDNRLSATTTLPNITTLTNLASVGTITSGVWNGTAIADGYLTKTGDWTGTLDGQEGSYYLANSFGTTSANAWLATKSTSDLTEGSNKYYTDARVASVIAGTTTDALAQGSTNKYYSSTLFNTDLASKSTSDLGEGSNLYYTPLRVAGVIAGTTTDALAQGSTNKYYSTSLFNGDLATKSTSDLSEGSNLYYTANRVAGVIAGTTTDALAEGLNNKYFTNTRFDNRLSSTSTLPNITSLANLAGVGTITSGVWNGTAIADGYLTKTGDWTGTLDGQEGSYYLANSFGTTSANAWLATKSTSNLSEGSNLYYTANRVAGVIAGTTTDALAQGSTNKYYASSLFDTDFALKSTTNLAEGSNLYYTLNRFAGALAGTTTDALTQGSTNKYYSTSLFNGDLATKSTSDLAEGTNLYYTVNRVAGAIAGTTTDALAEGSTNKYFTNTRFDNRLSATTTLPNITTLANLASVGTITSGTWQGIAIADGYLTKTGDWTGTLDGQEGSYYLANSFGTTSANVWLATKSTNDLPEGTNLYYTPLRVAGIIAGTTTDALAQGSTNKYYSSTLFNTDFALKSTTNLTEGTNLYYTALRVAGVIAGTTTDALAQGSTNKYYSTSLFNGDLATKSTSDLSEGTNLYYTSARVAGVIAGTTTDALAQGSTNKYWSNTLFDNRLSATTTLPNITSLANLAGVGTITSGVWNGTAIADAYLTKTGDWTGTLDGQEGAYYLANSFATTSANVWLATKTTDSLTQGSTNKYYSSTLFDADFATKSTTNLSEGTNLYYTPLRVAGVIAGTTTDALAQGSTNKYYSTSLFNGDLATKSTSDLAEGSNLYYTSNRVAGVIAGTTTDALAQGSTNKYWSNTLFDNRLSATTTLPNITTLANLASVGTITSGTWQGTTVADAYLTKTGDWTGTLDGQEGSYYLANSFATTSANVWLATKSTTNLSEGTNLYYTPLRVAGVIAGTTTDALAQGSTNKYYSDTLVGTYISGSSTIPHIGGSSYGDTLSWTGTGWTTRATSTLGVALSDTTGSLGVTRGGTGLTSIATGDILYGSNTNTLSALSAGTGGKVLGVVNGVPGWVATTTFSTGLTYSAGAVTVNTSQNIATLSNLTGNGFVKTSGSDGTLSIDTNTYLTGNQTITLSGDVSGSGATAIATTIGAGKVTNAMLAGSIAASKLVGTDINTVGTITAGTWQGDVIGDAYLTKSGNWTGTFDGQEGSYYLNANNLSNFGTPFYNYFSATTTDFLTQGSSNKYYADSLVNAYIHSSSTIAKAYTANAFTALNTFSGGLTITGLDGPLQANAGVVSATTSIGVLYGGTGLTTAPTYGKLLVGNASGGYTLTATSSLGIVGGSASAAGSGGYIQFNDGANAFAADSGLYWDNTAKRLGLGSTTPWAQLSINPDGITGPAFAIGSSTATKFLVANSGYVGIGVTNPLASLQIGAEDTIGSNAPNALISSASGDSSLMFTRIGSSGAVIGLDSDNIFNMSIQSGKGGLDFRTGGTYLAGISSTGVSRLRIIDGGNIGIGTSTPFSQLSVSTTTASSPTTSLFAVASSTHATLFNVLGNGNVGIGSTSPFTKLAVNGSAAFGTGNVSTSGTINLPNQGWITGRDSSNAADINLFQIDAAGRIQYGTSTMYYSDISGGFNSVDRAATFSIARDKTDTLTFGPINYVRADVSANYTGGTTTSPYNVRGVQGGYFADLRDPAGVTAMTKGSYYGFAAYVYPSIDRNDIPFDDVNGLLVVNYGTGKATDGIYIGNGTNIAAGTAEWNNALMIETDATNGIAYNGSFTTGIDLKGGTFSSSAIRLPSNKSITARNAADSNNVSLFKLNASDNVSLRDDSLIIDSSGRVGIGATSPNTSFKLDVSGGGGVIIEDTTPRIYLYDTDAGGTRPNITFGNNGYFLFAGDDTVYNDGQNDKVVTNFFSKFAAARTYDMHMRVFGKAANSFGNFIDVSHTGDSGFGKISTDVGNIVLCPTNSSSATAGCTSTGNVGIGTTTPSGVLTVYKTDGFGTYTDTRGTNTSVGTLSNMKVTDSGITSPLQANLFDTNINFASDPGTKTVNGVASFAIIPATNSTAASNLTVRAMNFTAANYGTGSAGIIYGLSGATVNNNTGSITTAGGGAFQIQNNNAGGTITNAIGMGILDLANSGTITNTYGVHVGDITTGTQTNTPYSFYASDTNAYNYFAGNVGIGTTTPFATLSVSTTTSASPSLPLFSVASSTNSAILTALGNGYVGIGTPAPTNNFTITLQTNDFGGGLDLRSYSANNPILARLIRDNSVGGGRLNVYADSDAATPKAVISASGLSYISNNFGVGTTTPFSTLSVSTTTASAPTMSLFAVASSTHATLFNVLGSGNVGIGMTSPSAKLHVGTNGTTGTGVMIDYGGASSYALNFGNASSTATISGYVKFSRSATGASTCATNSDQGIVYKNDAGTRVAHMCADSVGMESWAQAWNATATDVAENYSDIENILEPGDLVALTADGPRKSVVKTQGVKDSMMIGIVSTEPGVTLTDIAVADGATELVNPKPIALAGRVPTKVSTENGAIKVGDYITASSIPGVGMKATTAGIIVGRALEAYSGTGTGSILVFVNTGYFDGTMLAHSADLEQATSTPSQALNTNEITEGLEVITPKIIAKGLTVESISALDKEITFTSDVVFFGTPYFTTDTAGFAQIKKGDKRVEVTFDKAYIEKPILNANLSLENDEDAFFAEDIKYAISKATTTSFTIVLNKPASRDITFNWTALAVKNAKLFTSKAESVTPTPIATTPPSSTATSTPAAVILAPIITPPTASADTSTTTPDTSSAPTTPEATSQPETPTEPSTSEVVITPSDTPITAEVTPSQESSSPTPPTTTPDPVAEPAATE